MAMARQFGSAAQLQGLADSYRSQLVVVSCYTRFDNLAHGPRGTQAKRSLYTFRLDPHDGQMVLVSVAKDEVMNPAFSRFHTSRNLLYTCTESVAEPGEINTWKVDPATGLLTQLGKANAGGTSTCYLTLDRECRNMLVINYWNATIGVFGLDPADGKVLQKRFEYDPNEGRPMKARSDKHVNHSENDGKAQKERQADPHSHAVVLDTYFGRIAYVPDLGMDLIRQFLYSPEDGSLIPAGTLRSGPEDQSALGPRYMEFHPSFPVCYVVNELASDISVFLLDLDASKRLVEGGKEAAKEAEPSLYLMQSIRTIPDGFPGHMNTCGRICVHPSGNFVLVSNRGHDSIAVFRVNHGAPQSGLLSLAGIVHTRGATPRHFQFDASGQWLITANQDSDRIVVFHFNLATGHLDWTGHEYEVPSPNFVCAIRPHAEVTATSRL